MKKGWKCICTIGGVAALCAGASFVKDYRNMKRMEKRMGMSEIGMHVNDEAIQRFCTSIQ